MHYYRDSFRSFFCFCSEVEYTKVVGACSPGEAAERVSFDIASRSKDDDVTFIVVELGNALSYKYTYSRGEWACSQWGRFTT